MDSQQNTSQKAVVLVRKLLSNSTLEHRLDALERLVASHASTEPPAWSNSQETSLYCHLVSTILGNLSASTLQTAEEEELYDFLILRGPPGDVLLSLAAALHGTQRSYKQDKVVLLLSKFVENGHIEALLKSQCESSNAAKDTSWRQIETVLISLPERLANSLKTDVPSTFSSENYLGAVCVALHNVLLYACEKVRANTDLNVTCLGGLLGRLCTAGHSVYFASVALPKIVAHAERDFIFRRLCTKLVTSVPDCSSECVLTAIVSHLKSYTQVDWLYGDSVCTSSNLRYIFTIKLPLIRIFQKDDVLKNVIGHLASSDRRKPLFYELVSNILSTWGDKTLMVQHGEVQQRYLTRALMICTGHLRLLDQDKTQAEELMPKLLHGVQSHIASPDEKVRLYGMVVAENLSGVVQPNGPKLKFEYENCEEVTYLASLMDVSEEPNQASVTNVQVSEAETKPQPESETKYDLVSQDLDSDDDLEPYDMSHDKPLTAKKPMYLRDCMEGLREQEKAEWMEACLLSVVGLITKCKDELQDIVLELAKILLYLEDRFCTADFAHLRQQSLVTLIVYCPAKVVEYLADQFYDRGLNIGQRLDILDIFALASTELSAPTAKKTTITPKHCVTAVTEAHWERVVRERIEAKTKRIGKGRQEQPTATKNRFADVAGYFFYPLMRYYDRPQNTFDLMGDDSLVLAHLVYTLGIIQCAAVHSPRVCHMARCLVEFVSVLRYHVEAYVREAVLFALSMVVLNVPSSFLLSDLYTEMCEIQCWLRSVVERDASDTCKVRAVQVLQLLASATREEAPAVAERLYLPEFHR